MSAGIGDLLHRAWLAPECEQYEGWLLRSAEGVTQRANSVWPASPVPDVSRAVDVAEQYYRARRQPAIFQMLDDPALAGLDAELDRRRYTRQSRTLVLTASLAAVAASRDAAATVAAAGEGTADVELSAQPSEEWLKLWWRVDGRRSPDGLRVARRILAGCPSVYAEVRAPDGTLAAVGRLALADRWGGLYCIATDSGRRRQGYATRVVSALLGAGERSGSERFWLLVTEANTNAQALYSAFGFAESARYLYRQGPLRRPPGAC